MATRKTRAILASFAVLLATCARGASIPPLRKELLRQDWYRKAPPLPKPTGKVTKVSTVRELYAAARNLEEGETILIADGHYTMPRSLYIRKSRTTLRSASGDRTKVILDFRRSRHGEGVCISYATGVTIADLTVQNVTQNGIKINSNHNVQKVTLYNLVSHNVWQRHVKGVRVPDKNGQPQWINECRIRYCLFYNDRPKSHGDDPWEDGNRGRRMGYNYVGGIDVMGANKWIISDNVFIGIHGKTGEARGAIFLWHNSKDCIIERNIIIDCDAGICLGNSSARRERRHAVRCIVRNNFIVRCPESNLLADHTRDCVIVHNTVHDPRSRLRRLLRVVHANDGLVVRNNLFSGPRISIEKYTGRIDVHNNLIGVVPQYFVDPDRGNLHLTGKALRAIDKGQPIKTAPEDIDRARRDDKPDLGADEFGAPPNN